MNDSLIKKIQKEIDDAEIWTKTITQNNLNNDKFLKMKIKSYEIQHEFWKTQMEELKCGYSERTQII